MAVAGLRPAQRVRGWVPIRRIETYPLTRLRGGNRNPFRFFGPRFFGPVIVLSMPHSLGMFVGRAAVFVESGYAAAVTVEKAESGPERATATFRRIPDSFHCLLRRVSKPGDGPIEEIPPAWPFGESWDVEVSHAEFFVYPERDHWQASFLWGGGFRVWFNPSFVARFLKGDVNWMHEFYRGDDHDESTGG